MWKLLESQIFLELETVKETKLSEFVNFVGTSNLDLITTLRLLSFDCRNILLLELLVEVVSEEPYQSIEVV